jgi:heptosyltransferase II
VKILIETPSWLGDSIMATPAMENIINSYQFSEITLIGSIISLEALKKHPNVKETYILDKNYLNLYKNIKTYGKFDIFFSFRGSFRSIFLKFFISATKKYQYNKNDYSIGHQVERYNSFINKSLNIYSIPNELKLYTNNNVKNSNNKLLGINPGAKYGSAKRWYPDQFAQVAIELSSTYDIIILGGVEDSDIALDIEKYLIEKNVSNYKNLSAKTTISELINQISNLDLFITGDSGPMHVAAAFKIPTISIFGPTNSKETSQWSNEKSFIIKKNLACQPCMERSCPLIHHNCMKLIKASEVLKVINELN